MEIVNNRLRPGAMHK